MPSPWKVSPSQSFSSSIASLNETSIAVSSRRALRSARRPTEELQRLRLRRARRDPYCLERLLELAAVGIRERRFARLPDGRRAVGVGERAARDDRVEDPQEVRLRAPVRLAVTLDQASAERNLEREPEVAGRGGSQAIALSIRKPETLVVLTCSPTLSLSVRPRRAAHPVSARARRPGSTAAISSTPGLRYSMMWTGSPGFASTSLRTRSKRDRRDFRSATRITSS